MFIAFFKTIKFLVWIYDVKVMDMEVGGCRIATEFWNYVAKELSKHDKMKFSAKVLRKIDHGVGFPKHCDALHLEF